RPQDRQTPQPRTLQHAGRGQAPRASGSVLQASRLALNTNDPNPKESAREASKREQLEHWLGHFSQIDLLTELPNRSQFLDRLTGAIARAARSKQFVGVVLLNLDHFKTVNATYGHRMADLVLKKVGERLKECTRKSDSVGRLGGDEFAVILEGLAEKEGAAIATERLLKVLRQPMQFDGAEITITATVGVAFYPADAEDVDALLRNADIALCHAREHNRNCCQFYSAELSLQSQREQLRRAKIEKGLASLTPREREVLQILVAGNANKMIRTCWAPAREPSKTTARRSWTRWTRARYRNWCAWFS